MEVEHAATRAGRKFTLSSLRSSNRTSRSRLAIALSAPAFAVVAIASSGGFSASAAAQPITQAHTISVTATSALTSKAVTAGEQARRHRRESPKAIAWQMMHTFRWRPRFQFRYLNRLWERESSWNVRAENPYSGAYGIPQAVPGSKMASAGRYWQSSPSTQIRWGMRYIRARYGSPRNAWTHEIDYGWY